MNGTGGRQQCQFCPGTPVQQYRRLHGDAGSEKVHTAGYVCYDTSTARFMWLTKFPRRLESLLVHSVLPTLRTDAGNLSGYQSVEWIF